MCKHIAKRLIHKLGLKQEILGQWSRLTSRQFRFPIWKRVCLQDTNMVATGSVGTDDMLAVGVGREMECLTLGCSLQEGSELPFREENKSRYCKQRQLHCVLICTQGESGEWAQLELFEQDKQNRIH